MPETANVDLMNAYVTEQATFTHDQLDNFLMAKAQLRVAQAEIDRLTKENADLKKQLAPVEVAPAEA
jgi:hypothetical protein